MVRTAALLNRCRKRVANLHERETKKKLLQAIVLAELGNIAFYYNLVFVDIPYLAIEILDVFLCFVLNLRKDAARFQNSK